MRRVFIYGSCVTRDGEHLFAEHGLEMAGYVARQSLISAFRPATLSEYNLSKIASSFQRRMTRGDIEGNLRFEIQRARSDLIIWDICDERLGVKKAHTGGMVTHIRDHVAEGIHRGPFGPVIRFGTDEHYRLWVRGLQELLAAAGRYGLTERIVLNATPWALVDDTGKDLGDRPRRFNDAAQRYFSAAQGAGVTVARVAQEAAVASTTHKWGPAPFHYIENTYRAQLAAIIASAPAHPGASDV
ncbi:MAG: DUF6270 domain-containing protein [Propionibacteriaceae bacterium]|nr:DUF6270 domain-containing protein [Propionibacteriaceae bacterium]